VSEVRTVSIIKATALKKEAVSTSETSVYFYETRRRNIQEGYDLYLYRRENLKSRAVSVPFLACRCNVLLMADVFLQIDLLSVKFVLLLT
jgi:hypothetical protein